ncbi:MAG: ubiquitin-like protein Pup [Myxococcota bacterium]
MASGEQTQKNKQGGGESGGAATPDGAGQKKIAKKGEELKEEMDSLIDEIDEVLEENAEEFVKNYVQRGGE